jgi:uncharacterized protein (DUF433 family)
VGGYGHLEESGKGYPPPPIQASSPLLLLSFNNLVEASALLVLSGWASEAAVHRAVEEAKTSLGVECPLLLGFEGRLGEFFAERLFLTRSERLAFREVSAAHSICVERDERGVPVRFWPRVGGKLKADWVNLNPKVLFGAPAVGGVETRILAWRYDAGEELEELAEDYSLPLEAVLEAVAFEGATPQHQVRQV